MLGIGGGMIIIPLLALAFDGQGIAHQHVLHLSVGTAMASIAFTSLSSMRAHASRKAVRWEFAIRMTPGILLGSLMGASHLAKFLSTRALAIYFAVFVLVMAINMAMDLRPKPAREPLGAPGMFAAGFLISGLSALIAMGGAVLTVPLMLYMQVPMIHAIGTAPTMGFPIAVGGTAGYLATGWGDAGIALLEPRLRLLAGTGGHCRSECCRCASGGPHCAQVASQDAEADVCAIALRSGGSDAGEHVVSLLEAPRRSRIMLRMARRNSPDFARTANSDILGELSPACRAAVLERCKRRDSEVKGRTLWTQGKGTGT